MPQKLQLIELEMKWQCLRNKLLNILFISLLIIIPFFIGRRSVKVANKNVSKIDTTYNNIILDSIKYNIIYKDSIITKLRYKYETKIIEVNNLSDSASVELFKKLCTEDSLYD